MKFVFLSQGDDLIGLGPVVQTQFQLYRNVLADSQEPQRYPPESRELQIYESIAEALDAVGAHAKKQMHALEKLTALGSKDIRAYEFIGSQVTKCAHALKYLIEDAQSASTS